MRRHLEANKDQSLEELKSDLRVRLAEIVDPQHALLLLREVKQKSGETIQVYLERLIDISEDCFDGQDNDLVQRQLIGYFIDGLVHDYLKMRVMRSDPNTLDEAVAIATVEQNIRKRFNLGTGHDYDRQNANEQQHTPMDVDLFRWQLFCANCKMYDHVTRDCRRSDMRAVNAFAENSRMVCWHCTLQDSVLRREQVNRLGTKKGRFFQVKPM